MKVLIPFGAGVESTTLAYEALRDTTHDIVLSHFDDSYRIVEREWENIVSIEREKMDDIVDWLTRNVRAPAEVRKVSIVRLPESEKIGVRVPVGGQKAEAPNDGFDIYPDWGLERRGTEAAEANEIDADEVWSGWCTWDVDNDWAERYWQPYFERKVTRQRLHKFPFMEKGSNGFWHGAGRMEIRCRMPNPLFALTVQCHLEVPCGTCNRCILNSFYDRYCSMQTLGYIQEVDDAIARKYHLGKYLGNAPRNHNIFDKYKLDIDFPV